MGIINTVAGNGYRDTTTGYGGYSGDGGQAIAAELNLPNGLTIDKNNNLYISDTYNNRVRMVSHPLTLSVNSATLCLGATTTLTANGASSYNWSPSVNLNDTNTASVIANPTTTVVYTVTGTSTVTTLGVSNVSTATVYSSVFITTPPTINYTLVQDTVPHTWNIFPTVSGGIAPYSYLWNWGDGLTSNIAYPSHTYSVAGTYNICVTVTDANGCSSTYCQTDAVSRLGNNNPLSTMVYVNVKNSTSGIQNISAKNEINIYPNPTQTNFTIETNTNEKQTLQLFDVNGKLILTQPIIDKTIIDVSNLNAGVYNLNLVGNAGVMNKKLIIVK